MCVHARPYVFKGPENALAVFAKLLAQWYSHDENRYHLIKQCVKWKVKGEEAWKPPTIPRIVEFYTKIQIPVQMVNSTMHARRVDHSNTTNPATINPETWKLHSACTNQSWTSWTMLWLMHTPDKLFLLLSSMLVRNTGSNTSTCCVWYVMSSHWDSKKTGNYHKNQ